MQEPLNINSSPKHELLSEDLSIFKIIHKRPQELKYYLRPSADVCSCQSDEDGSTVERFVP